MVYRTHGEFIDNPRFILADDGREFKRTKAGDEVDENGEPLGGGNGTLL